MKQEINVSGEQRPLQTTLRCLPVNVTMECADNGGILFYLVFLGVDISACFHIERTKE